MNWPTYKNIQSHFANNCKECKGDQTIVGPDGIRRECMCQKCARSKWRLEQAPIRPNSLKYKGWEDFNGTIEANGEIVGNLTVESAFKGRDKAFQYCFNVPFSPKVLSQKTSKLYIHNRVFDGQNVIIVGDSGSGRSLLAFLIYKEIICASPFLDTDLESRWVETYDLIDAARWTSYGSTDKAINHAYLDDIADLHFLFLEGVGIQTRGHNSPPDHFVLDKLFGSRRSLRLPTIITCSKDLWKLAAGRNPKGRDEVHKIYGNQFLEFLLDSSNVVIDLEIDNVK